MKEGDYYTDAFEKQYFKIIKEKNNKFYVFELTFPASGIQKVTKSVVEYACKQVSADKIIDVMIEMMKLKHDYLKDEFKECIGDVISND